MKRAKMDLARLMEGVERWRQERAHVRAPAPTELWDAAVEVAREEGVYATARAIRFDSSRLKARVSEAASAGLRVPSARSGAARKDATAFVAIEVSAAEGRGATSETVVELVGRHGDRMRIVAALGAVDVVGLAQKFWSQAS